MADVRDIMELDRPPTPELTREAIIGIDKPKKKLNAGPKPPRRPEGMHREVFALLYNDNKDVPPLFPSDTGQYSSLNLGGQLIHLTCSWKWLQASKNQAGNAKAPQVELDAVYQPGSN